MLRKLLSDLLAENLAYNIIAVNVLVFQVSLGQEISAPIIISMITSLISTSYVIVTFYMSFHINLLNYFYF